MSFGKKSILKLNKVLYINQYLNYLQSCNFVNSIIYSIQEL